MLRSATGATCSTEYLQEISDYPEAPERLAHRVHKSDAGGLSFLMTKVRAG